MHYAGQTYQFNWKLSCLKLLNLPLHFTKWYVHITICKQEKSFGTICTSIRRIVHLPLYLIKTNCAYAAGVIFTGRYKLSTLLTVAVRNGNTKAFQLHHTHKKNKEEKPISPDHHEMRRRQQFGRVCLCVCKRNLPILRRLRLWSTHHMFVQGKNRIGSKGQLVTPDRGQKFTILYIKIKQNKKEADEYYQQKFKSVAIWYKMH